MRAIIFPSFLAVTTLLLLSACDGSAQDGSGGGMQMPPPEVTVMTLTEKDVPLDPEYPGRTQGSREVEIRARVGGILLKRSYEEGEFIEKGKVMFEIDPDQYKVALDRARAQLGQAQATLKAAQRNWDRVDPLYKEQAVSARTRDEALSALESAKASVGLANAEVNAAKLNLDYTKVEAPIAGITSKEAVSEGSLIGTGPTDGLLTRMIQLDPIYVNFAYPDSDFLTQRDLMESGETDLEGAQKQLQATLVYGDDQEYKQSGTVSFTDTKIDTQTGSVNARAVFPNPDGRLLPGQFVRLTINGVTFPKAISIPQAAVLQGPQGKFVYRLGEGNKAEIASITTGVEHGEEWIVETGLKAGDVIILDNLMKVQPNSPVSVKQPGEAPTGVPQQGASGSAPEAPVQGNMPEAAPAQEPSSTEQPSAQDLLQQQPDVVETPAETPAEPMTLKETESAE